MSIRNLAEAEMRGEDVGPLSLPCAALPQRHCREVGWVGSTSPLKVCGELWSELVCLGQGWLGCGVRGGGKGGTSFGLCSAETGAGA